MPVSNSSVKFKFGLQSAYTALVSKDDNTAYFCTDSGRLFVGSQEYGSGGGGGGTDEKVLQSVSSANADHPLLVKNSANATQEIAGTKYASAVTLNPSSGHLSATSFSGSGLQLTNVGRAIRFNCTTSAGTDAKVTTTTSIDGLTLTDTDLVDGLVIDVYFRFPDNSTAPTLKVSNCSAFPIGIRGIQGDEVSYVIPPIGAWQYGQLVQFMFTTTNRSGSTLADKGVWMMTNPGYVTQVASTGSTAYPVLMCYSNTANYSALNDASRYCVDVKIKSSTGELIANDFSGGTVHEVALTKSTGTDGPASTTLYYTQVGKLLTLQMSGFTRTATSQQVEYTFTSTLPTPKLSGRVFNAIDQEAGSVAIVIDVTNKKITFPNGSVFDSTDTITWTYLVQ